MSVQVQAIIDKIRAEGVKAAEDEAASILQKARAEAEDIVSRARKEADQLRQAAARDREREVDSGRQALAQAARDAVLSLKARIQAILDALIAADTAKALGPDAIAAALPKILEGLSRSQDLSVILGGDAASYTEAWMAALAKKLKGGVQILPPSGGQAGFRVEEKGGAAYYDFSVPAVAALISRHLGPTLADIVKNAAREA